MASAPDPTGDELLAGELSLGLLENKERAAARARQEREPAFARMVAEWDERFAPLLDEVAPVIPDAGLWDRIRAELDAQANVAPILQTRRRGTNFWRAYSIAITAVAAALLLAIGLDRARDTPVAPTPTPAETRTLIASLASEDGPTRLVVSYQSGTPSLLVTPAGLSAAAGRAYQLWLISPSGTPQSLGLVDAGGPQRVPLAPPLLGAFDGNATLAVSVEPAGGSPTGQPTGPVILSGPLRRI